MTSNRRQEMRPHSSIPSREDTVPKIPQNEETIARMSRISPEMQQVENTLKILLKSPLNLSSPEEAASLKKLTSEVQKLSQEVRAIQSQLHVMDKPPSTAKNEQKKPHQRKLPLSLDLSYVDNYYLGVNGSTTPVDMDEESSQTESTTSPGSSPNHRAFTKKLPIYSPSIPEASSPSSHGDVWQGYATVRNGARRGIYGKISGSETLISSRPRNPNHTQEASKSQKWDPSDAWKLSPIGASEVSGSFAGHSGGRLGRGRKKKNKNSSEDMAPVMAMAATPRGRRNSMTDLVVTADGSGELDAEEANEETEGVIQRRRRGSSLDYVREPSRRSFEDRRPPQGQLKSPLFSWKGTWGGPSPRKGGGQAADREAGPYKLSQNLSWLDNLKTPRRRSISSVEGLEGMDFGTEFGDSAVPTRRRKSLTLLKGLSQQLGMSKGPETPTDRDKTPKAGTVSRKGPWGAFASGQGKFNWPGNCKDSASMGANEISEEIVRCMAALYIRHSQRFQAPVFPPHSKKNPGYHTVASPKTPSSKYSLSKTRDDILGALISPKGSQFYNIPYNPPLLRSTSGIGSCKVKSPLELEAALWGSENGDERKLSILNSSRPFYGSSDYGYMQCILEPPLEVCEDPLDTQAYFRYETLIDQLDKVNPSRLCHEEKLAFWVNVYNAVLMHTHIIHCHLNSETKMSILMSKAVLRVGGVEISALEIEHCILRASSHRSTQMANTGSHAAIRLLGGKKSASKLPMVKKFDLVDVRRKWALEEPEPSVSFALCTGSQSGPALRLYTAYDVKDELERARTMFLLANVGISSSRMVLIPSVLDWYWKDFVSEKSQLADWLALQLPSPHRQVLQESLIQLRRKNADNCYEIEPHEWKFRYLIDPF